MDSLIVFFSKIDRPKLVLEVLIIVADLSLYKAEQLVQMGFVKPLISWISLGGLRYQELAVLAIGNIVGEGPQMRDFVINNGVIQPLLALVNQETPTTLLRTVTWTMSNFCRNRTTSTPVEVMQCLPVLAQLVQHSDREVLADACWALSYLADSSGEIQVLIFQQAEMPKSRKMNKD